MKARSLSNHRRALRAALWMVAVALFFAVTDPLGIDSAGDQRSAQAWDRVAALGYPDSARSLITTVSIDEASLAAVDRQWPPQYDFYAEVLTALTGVQMARPAAVFLDFTFMSELYDRDGRDTFVNKVAEVTHAAQWVNTETCYANPVEKLRCIIRSGGTPVIIGKPYPIDRCDVTETLLMLDQVALLTPLGWKNLAEDWLPAITVPTYENQVLKKEGKRLGDPQTPCPSLRGGKGVIIERELPKTGFTSGPTKTFMRLRGVSNYDLTPATALFAALCIQRPKASAQCGKLFGADFEAFLRKPLKPQKPPEAEDPQTYKVFWGSIPDPQFMDLEEEKLYSFGPNDSARAQCRAERSTLGHGLKIGAAQLFADLTENGTSTSVPCAYHADIRYDLLGATDLTPPLQKPLDEVYARFIKGRLILVGSALAQSNDWVSSTTRIRAPGVTLHAMALDNLLVWGADLKHAPPPLLKPFLDSGEVVELILTLVMGYAITRMALAHPAGLSGRGPKARGKRWRRLGVALAAVVAALALFVLATWILTVLLNWTPVNFAGLWTLSVALSAATFRESLVQAPADALAGLKTHRRRLRRLARQRRAARSQATLEESP